MNCLIAAVQNIYYNAAAMINKVKTLNDVLLIVAAMRANGQRIVFTNGCFELLHVGHIRYLQAARNLGDCLIVGLNSDESVRMIKGAPRPLVPQAERAELLAALACVDYVVIFNEPTAENLVAALKPEVYVKGGDYAASSSEYVKGLKMAPEMAVVQAYGGQVVVLPYISGHSTTRLIESIMQLYGETRP